MRTIKLSLAYDGTDFAGWQRQAGRRTVQETLEAVIEKVTGRRGCVLASGRTDAGVHALGQVVSFKTSSRLPVEVLGRAINAELPRCMAVLEAAEAPAEFHATHDAVRKQYRYVIHDGPIRPVFQRHYCWQYSYGRLDAAAMRRAAAALVGTHDFSSFQTSGAPRKTSVRTIFDIRVERGRGEGGRPGDWGLGIGDWSDEGGRRRAEGGGRKAEGGRRKDEGNSRRLTAAGEGPIPNPQTLIANPQSLIPNPQSLIPNPQSLIPNPQSLIPNPQSPAPGDHDFITFEIEADGFLYNMVRAIVGTLVEVGRGAKPESWPAAVLEARNRRAGGRTAPPQGLFLVKVEYGERD